MPGATITRLVVSPPPAASGRSSGRHGGTALVIDHGCSPAFLAAVESARLGRPLDSKRPTVDRRFLCDEAGQLAAGLQVSQKRLASLTELTAPPPSFNITDRAVYRPARLLSPQHSAGSTPSTPRHRRGGGAHVG